MAVTFQPDGYTIQVFTGCNPVENWLDTQKQLCDAITAISEVECNNDGYWLVINLLREMMPDIKTAEKMNPKK
jgi:hypothetical protein